MIAVQAQPQWHILVHRGVTCESFFAIWDILIYMIPEVGYFVILRRVGASRYCCINQFSSFEIFTLNTIIDLLQALVILYACGPVLA